MSLYTGRYAKLLVSEALLLREYGYYCVGHGIFTRVVVL